MSVVRILRALLPERALSAPERVDLQEYLSSYNARAVRAAMPFMLLVHLANVLLFARITASTPGYRQWTEWLVWIHAAALPASIGFFVVARRPRDWLGEATAWFYVMLGAVLSANAQRSHAAVNAFVGCSLAAAVLLRTRPVMFLPAVVTGGALVIAGAFHFQADVSVAWSNTLMVVALSLVALITFFVTHIAKTREWIARRELERINSNLEERVEAQVQEMVARAYEVEQLNIQLSAQVQERSEALSKALARLSDRGSHAPGTLLMDRFELERPIGFGGMGVVYRGFDRLTQANVAVKMIQAASAQELDGLHRFLREARVTASVSHPAVVRSLHVDVSDDGRLFQVMELVEGEPLDERLRRDGKIAWPQVARLGSVLAEGLAAAHAAGIVHRDVKPPNVMLTRSAPGLKLLDFGVSKLRDARVDDSRSTGNRLVGTPEFMAPEQIADATKVGEKADVYGLGIILYQCIAGQGPFPATTPNQWLHAHVLVAPIDLAARMPECPPRLVELVMSCLRKDPETRPLASEAAQLLRALADEAQVPSLETLEAARPPRVAAPRSLEHDPTLSVKD